MQGKMVLRLVMESFVSVGIFTLLIVLVPKVKALRLIHFVGRLASEVSRVIDRPLNPAQNLFDGELETAPCFFSASAALLGLLRGRGLAC